MVSARRGVMIRSILQVWPMVRAPGGQACAPFSPRAAWRVNLEAGTVHSSRGLGKMSPSPWPPGPGHGSWETGPSTTSCCSRWEQGQRLGQAGRELGERTRQGPEGRWHVRAQQLALCISLPKGTWAWVSQKAPTLCVLRVPSFLFPSPFLSTRAGHILACLAAPSTVSAPGPFLPLQSLRPQALCPWHFSLGYHLGLLSSAP